MGKRKDLTGQRFGRLVVINYAYSNAYNASYWHCVCDCGNEITVRGTALTSGITSSCGCMRHEPKREDLIGKRFGRLMVLDYVYSNRYRAPYWRCLCDCGNEVIARGSELKVGNVRSCGCFHRDNMSEIHTTHGMGWLSEGGFETIHNYIELETNMVRKGAISAKKGEKVLIPINMRDGCIIGIGKGNDDWNQSAPHGAGRIMSRHKARESVSLDEFKEAMDGIYTTSVSVETIDEAPMAYKPMDEIIENIKDTVDILEIIKPVYNFKASEG